MNRFVTGEWVVDKTSAQQRRVIHYWATVLWLTVGLVAFVGFMSLYAIWITHLAGWAAETPVESEADAENATTERGSPGSAEVDTANSLAQAEPT